METSNSNIEIQAWLDGLEGAESKRHESVALAISKNPTYDARIIMALKRITRSDPQSYARNAARQALEVIAQQHFAAGNEIRTYLEQLRMNPNLAADTQRASASAPVKPTPPQPPAIPQQSVVLEPQHPQVAQRAETERKVEPVMAVAKPTVPAAPAVPFDQWLLSERNIKFALYSGGFLLILAGLIFVGVNWQYLPGIAKLAVTLVVTAAMYGGGILLFKRPSLKVGGTALLAIASGFLPLNFVIAQLYLFDSSISTFNVLWLFASIVCGAIYALTAVRTQHALFSVFMGAAIVSAATMAFRLLNLSTEWSALGYAVMTIGIMALAYWSATRPAAKFQARTLRVFAHILVVLTALGAVGVWAPALSGVFSSTWLPLVALALMGALYAVDDWHKKSLYARWGAAIVFGLWVTTVCLQLGLSGIQTGIVLKIFAAVYLLLGNFLQRGKTLRAGAPLYAVGASLAALISAQSLLEYTRNPEQLMLAVVADVGLLALAAYLSRRVEFVYGAVAAALIPVWIFGDLLLADPLQRALAFAAVLVLYTAVGLRLGPKQWRWALPFLIGGAFLSALVPLLLYPQVGVIAVVLVGIAALYTATAVRFNQEILVFPAIAAVNLAIVSAARYFYPFDFELARVLAWAFCGWAVVLFFARRALLYVRLNDWAMPLLSGAVANFGLVYFLLIVVATSDMLRNGIVSQQVVFTLLSGVGVLALNYGLYRRVEFLYVAVLLAIAPAYLQARLLLGDAAQIGLVLCGMLLGYFGIGIALGWAHKPQERLRGEAGAFLVGAALLSLVVVTILYPNYAVLSLALVGIVALYAFASVWLRWQWLSLAAVTALDFAILMGVRALFQFPGDLSQMSGLGLTIAGIGLTGTAVWLKLRGWNAWRVPLYLGAGVNLLLGFTLMLTRESLLAVVVSVAVAAVCFVMQWVERSELEKLKLPPVLTYVGAALMLAAVYLAARVAQFETPYSLVALAVGALGLMAASWYLYGFQNDATAKLLYEKPLWYMGVTGMVAALVLLIPTSNYLAGALGYAVAALAFGLHTWLRRDVWFGYAAGAAVVASIWWLLRYLDVSEVQAFVVPLGVLALGIGWNELRIGRRLGFQFATVLGLVLLMGSAFYQSLGNINYAVLLLIESILAFGIGVRMRSRFYVQAAILALVGNGLVQFGPALVDLPRWIQIGAIGGILVTSGLLALFRRQRLLEMRSAFTDGWKRWQP